MNAHREHTSPFTIVVTVLLLLFAGSWVGHLLGPLFPSAPDRREHLSILNTVPEAFAAASAADQQVNASVPVGRVEEMRATCQALGSRAYVPGSACTEVKRDCYGRVRWTCPSIVLRSVADELLPAPRDEWDTSLGMPYVCRWPIWHHRDALSFARSAA